MSRLRFGLLALLMAFSTSRAHSEPEPKTPAPNALCDRESTAIGRVACRLADAIPREADAALVVAAAALGDPRVALPGAINERLAQLVAAKLGPAATPRKEPLTLVQAQHAA